MHVPALPQVSQGGVVRRDIGRIAHYQIEALGNVGKPITVMKGHGQPQQAAVLMRNRETV